MHHTAKNLRNVIKTVEDIQNTEKGQSDNFTHVCVYVKAREAERILRDLMGDPRLILAQIMAASQPQRDPRDGRPLPPVQPPQKLRMYYITADERTNSVMVNGPPDKIAQARGFFNDSVAEYNTTAQVFPASVIARLCNFQEYPLFAAELDEKAVPKLQMG